MEKNIKNFSDFLNEEIKLVGQSFGSEMHYVIPNAIKLDEPDSFGREFKNDLAVKISKEGIIYYIDKSKFSEKQIKNFEKTLDNFKKSKITWD